MERNVEGNRSDIAGSVQVKSPNVPRNVPLVEISVRVKRGLEFRIQPVGGNATVTAGVIS